MLLDVTHRLRFSYDDYIRESWMELRIQPRQLPHQRIHSFYLAVGPPAPVARYLDWSGNFVHHFGVVDFHDRIEVLARSVVEVGDARPPLTALREAPATDPGPLVDLTLFGGPVVRSSAVEALDRTIPTPADAPLGEQVAAMGSVLRDRFRYQPGVTDYQSTSDHFFEHGAGVCQDFAHALLALLRLRRIPCRYVSGYLHVERGGREPSQSHAWVEVHGREGWAAFDPTHDRVPDGRYVVVAYGRHYDDVPPNRGIYRGKANEHLEAEVHTAPTQPRDLLGLHEQIESLEVPVYRDLPTLPSPARSPEQREAGQQQ